MENVDLDTQLNVPTSYVKKRLHPLGTKKSDTGVETEFNTVRKWADSNSTVVKLIKTKELIFYNPRGRLHSDFTAILTIERATSANLLGTFKIIKCDVHFKHRMTVSSQTLHILKVFKR